MQSHPASLPADIKGKNLTSARASMPGVHHKQTSDEEKLISLSRMHSMHREERSKKEKLSLAKLSTHSRHRREEVDIGAQTKGIRSIDRYRREKVDISLALTKGIGFRRHGRREVDIKNALMKGGIVIRSILLHQLNSLQQLNLHRCPASTNFKLLARHLVWELLWVHQRNALTVPASLLSSSCIMSKKSSTTQRSLSNLVQHSPLHVWQVIIIYCMQIIVNIYLEQLIDIIFNIDMGIQD